MDTPAIMWQTFFGVFLFGLALAVAVVWILFPFLVLGRMTKAQRTLDAIDQKLFVIATNSNRQEEYPPAERAG